MDQIVQAINSSHSRDWVDYLAIFAPFVLSIVAVWVSVSTARRQNKIALFEKRFVFYCELHKLTAFSEAIEICNSKEEIYKSFRNWFCNGLFSEVLNNNDIPSDIIAYHKSGIILSQGEFLFNIYLRDQIIDLISALGDLLAVARNDNNTSSCDLIEAVSNYHDKINSMVKTQKKIKNALKIH